MSGVAGGTRGLQREFCDGEGDGRFGGSCREQGLREWGDLGFEQFFGFSV